MQTQSFLRPLLVASALVLISACTTAANGGGTQNKEGAGSSESSSNDSGSTASGSSASGSASSASGANSNSGQGKDRTGDASGAIADGSEFNMLPGDGVTLADQSQLRYLRVANDSRCPADVQCVWAGNAELAFEWRSAAGVSEAFSLNSGQGDKTRELAERTLTLVSLASGGAPRAQLRIERTP